MRGAASITDMSSVFLDMASFPNAGKALPGYGKWIPRICESPECSDYAVKVFFFRWIVQSGSSFFAHGWLVRFISPGV